MQIIRDSHRLRGADNACVATIGNFDGVHRGHRAVLGGLCARAAEYQLPSCVITFEPLPQEYFAGERSVARLTRLREKLELLAASGIDRVLLLRFNQRLAQQPAADFIEQTLVRDLNVRHLVVGDDFRFGAGRRGDFAALQTAGREHGFAVEPTATYSLDADRVSSTRIRQLLAEGELDAAAELLGRPYAISGRVIHGEQIGRQLGYRTANIALQRRQPPLRGVFAVTASGLDGITRPGMANLGSRPTVAGLRTLLEVHLFDFSGDLYTQPLTIEFHRKLRSEQKFDSLDALRAAIAGDEREARAFFSGAE